MSDLIDAFGIALKLIFTGDAEVWGITARTLAISLSATCLAALICIPIACLIHFNSFKGKGVLITFIQTLYAIPTVLIGLLLYLAFSSSGPLGSFNIMFTPTLMVIGQIVLISPLITGLTISALNGAGPEIRDTAISLGAGRIRMAWTVILEVRYGVINAVLIGWGRAVSEVGIAIMLGANIRGYTRVLTTAIALETSKGEIAFSMALGLILLGLALVVIIFAVIIPSWLQHKAGRSLQK